MINKLKNYLRDWVSPKNVAEKRFMLTGTKTVMGDKITDELAEWQREKKLWEEDLGVPFTKERPTEALAVAYKWTRVDLYNIAEYSEASHDKNCTWIRTFDGIQMVVNTPFREVDRRFMEFQNTEWSWPK